MQGPTLIPWKANRCVPPHPNPLLRLQMEFCPRTLRDVLDSRELDEERRWSILRQILAGLAHIHSQGIIHRDLKVRGAACRVRCAAL